MVELTGLHALVVEDEGSVALLIEDMLERLGCSVASSAVTIAAALNAARSGTFDFAVLDVNLNGQLVFPVAEVLQNRKVPFVFSTGYGPIGIPESFSHYEVLSKPFAMEELELKLRKALHRP